MTDNSPNARRSGAVAGAGLPYYSSPSAAANKQTTPKTTPTNKSATNKLPGTPSKKGKGKAKEVLVYRDPVEAMVQGYADSVWDAGTVSRKGRLWQMEDKFFAAALENARQRDGEKIDGMEELKDADWSKLGSKPTIGSMKTILSGIPPSTHLPCQLPHLSH